MPGDVLDLPPMRLDLPLLLSLAHVAAAFSPSPGMSNVRRCATPAISIQNSVGGAPLARLRRGFAVYNYRVDVATAKIMAKIHKPSAPPPESLDISQLAYMPIEDVRAKFEGRVVPAPKKLPDRVWAEQTFARIQAARMANAGR